MEHWSIYFCENENGKIFVDDLFRKLQKDRVILKSLKDRMDIYTKYPIKNLGKDLEYLESDIYELKFHLQKRTQVRFLGCLSQDKKKFFVLVGFIKKTQKIIRAKIELALARKYILRNYGL